MRLFIGLPVPEELQHALRQGWNNVPGTPTKDKPTKPSSWHVTLAFLDDVREEHLEKLYELVAMSIKHPPAGIFTIDGFESFPKRNPTRIVAHITPEFPKTWTMFVDGIRDLSSLVAPGVDRKPWKPHISIIRQEKGLKLEGWSEKMEPIVWKPAELAIIKSTPKPAGSQYENLHVFSLNV